MSTEPYPERYDASFPSIVSRPGGAGRTRTTWGRSGSGPARASGAGAGGSGAAGAGAGRSRPPALADAVVPGVLSTGLARP